MVARNLNSTWLRVPNGPCHILPTQARTLRIPSLTIQRHAFSSSTASLRNSPSSNSCLHAARRPSQAQSTSPNLPWQNSRSASRLSRAIMPRPGSSAETYVAYGMTQKLFEACSSQAEYSIPQVSQKGAQVPKTEAGEDLGVGEGWWYQDLGLPPTFSTWSQITFLHMYLLTVRLRALPSHESLQTYSRHLIDHFSHNAEHRMDVLHGLTSRAIRNKFLKDLFIQWRGVIAAYDEGLIKGDAVLGAAVWRNLWKASQTGPDGQELDWAKVARVVAYMRRVIHELSQVSEADLIFDLNRRSGGRPGIFGYSDLDKKAVDAKR
ncbi:ubiquinol-cytochrome C chaperone-domain-containing protein [Aspergillus ambiguus]|uniref:uncharacterized protein n=1 Tax=Aspergillus ambiguus TaxID=176160 RepID=UPI003CCD4F81